MSNTIEKKFENASRKRFRFAIPGHGTVCTEDLWTLPLSSKNSMNLDQVAKAVNRELQTLNEESFVEDSPKGSTELHEKLDIVKHIIAVKKAEAEEHKTAAATAERKRVIREFIGTKENLELASKPLEELRAMLEE